MAAALNSANSTRRSDALVFFGSTGDLAFKQIYPALLALVRAGRLDLPVVAVGRKELGTDALRDRIKKALESEGDVDAGSFETLSRRLQYVAVDDENASSFTRIREALGGARRPLHYLALPPESFQKTAEDIAKAGLAENARLALEKPFGTDLASAQALSKALHESFPEESIFRLDHFLGKEPVENVVYFRAANPLVENALEAGQVASVQITMAETFGVKGRAKFYDAVGAIRDVVQNHMLEVIACLAMELPSEGGHAALRASRSRLLAQVSTLDPRAVVRGQVRGYKDEEGVAKGSTTETFAALRLGIDSDRWRGVPFFVRVGKSLPVTATEAVVTWRRPGAPVLDETSLPHANRLRLRISPDPQITLQLNRKRNGESMIGEATELVLKTPQADAMKAYERLLGDAIDGDPTLFARQDAVEQSWRVVDPILAHRLGSTAAPLPYEPGSWGPEETEAVGPEGGWVNPA